MIDLNVGDRIRGHDMKIPKNKYGIDLPKKFFSLWVVKTWNGLWSEWMKRTSYNTMLQLCIVEIL